MVCVTRNEYPVATQWQNPSRVDVYTGPGFDSRPCSRDDFDLPVKVVAAPLPNDPFNLKFVRV